MLEGRWCVKRWDFSTEGMRKSKLLHTTIDSSSSPSYAKIQKNLGSTMFAASQSGLFLDFWMLTSLRIESSLYLLRWNKTTNTREKHIFVNNVRVIKGCLLFPFSKVKPHVLLLPILHHTATTSEWILAHIICLSDKRGYMNYHSGRCVNLAQMHFLGGGGSSYQ